MGNHGVSVTVVLRINLISIGLTALHFTIKNCSAVCYFFYAVRNLLYENLCNLMILCVFVSIVILNQHKNAEFNKVILFSII